MTKILFPYSLGILLGHYFVMGGVSLFLVGTILFMLILGIVLLNCYQRNKRWTNGGISVLILLFLLVFGYWSTIKTNPTTQQNYFAAIDAEQYVGEVVDEPVIREKSVRFPVAVKSAQRGDTSLSVQGTLMVTVSRSDSTHMLLKYGDIIAFTNRITEVPPSYNPREFDYKGYLANKDIWYQCYLFFDQYELLSSNAGNPFLLKSLALRQLLMNKFDIYLHSERAFQVAVALIFGYRSQIDAATLDAFTDTGTIHVLSVSGLHVGLVFGFLTLLLGWLDRFRYGKIIRCGVILLFVWLYVVLTGMAPPILRAGIMISFFLVSTMVGRKQVAFNTLAASAFFILFFSPKSLFDVGFQLSYLAILGILLFYPLMRFLYLPPNKYLTWIIEYSYVSIAAQLFTLPLVLYYFGQFPTYFLFANLFIALPSMGVMYIGLLLAICPFEFINSYFGKILDFLLLFSISGLEGMANLPFAVIRGIAWPPLLMVVGLIGVVGLTVSLNNRDKRAVFVTALTIVVIAFSFCWQFIIKTHYSGLKVYNVHSGLALSYIEKGKVLLFSSYDSITHPTLIFKVLPDLIRYVDVSKIEFIRVHGNEKRNTILQAGNKHMAIVEDRWLMLDKDSLDVVIWRKNNKASLDEIKKRLKKNGMIVFDGSNTDSYLANFSDNLEKNASMIYWLKDNFAYVWNGY